MISDQIEELPDGTLIQHGPYNDRIYLMKLAKSCTKKLPINLINMARQYGYTKIFVKVPEYQAEQFAQVGYSVEATIPGLYNGSEKGLFMGYYLNDIRVVEQQAEILDNILRLAKDKSGTTISSVNKENFSLKKCKEKDAEKMASLYREVFKTYPFPIHDPLYLRDTMQQNVNYFGVEKNGNLVALSSAEIDVEALNVEMTDFATSPEWQGNSLGIHLLLLMEKEMKQKGIKVAYTIARAASLGINIVFSKLGYQYGGRLKNNTNIFGNIESMNIWHKTLS